MTTTRKRRGTSDPRSVRGRRSDTARSATAKRPKRKIRWKIVRRRAVAVLSVLSLLGLGYLLLFTPMVGVKAVEVGKTTRIQRNEVVELAKIPMLRSMLLLDTDAVEQRVATLPEVDSVSVDRSWPSTVRIEITEREPIAYFAAYDGIRLVDREGVPFHEVATPPKGLPHLKVRTVATDDPATRAATKVLTGIPRRLAERVDTVVASSSVDVVLRLSTGKVVHWGDAERMGRKTRVLAVLLNRPGRVYDVSSPELPTVSR